MSFFGRTQINYIKSGTGSGGLVHTEYVVNIIDGALANPKISVNTELVDIYRAWVKENPFDEGNGWATEPWFQKEYVPDESIVKIAREKSDVAVIVIGRTAGEDRDNAPEKGSWYLTDEEEALLQVVSKYFENTVVLLNVGNIIDMKWVEKYNIKSVMYVWQGGQEGGNAVCDVLSGEVNPSGRLSDTIAQDISDYPSSKNFGGKDFNLYQEDIYVGYRYFETFAPEKVLYPFGFGLSYTEFDINPYSIKKHNDKISAVVIVKNTGNVKGSEVVQVYVEAPQGKLGKAKRSLCAFAKTAVIMPDKSDGILLEFDVNDLASYDDSGITGHKSCYVLEAGEYNIYIGNNVRDAKKAFTFTIDELTVTKHFTEALAPERDFDVLYPTNNFKPAYRSVSTRTVDYDKRIADNLPETIEYTGDRGIKLVDVKNEKNTIEEFVSQLSDTDLRCIVIAQNDVFMLSSDAITLNSNIAESLENGTLTRGQLQRNAQNILSYIMETHTFERFIENGGKLETSLKDGLNELETIFKCSKVKSGETIEANYKNTGKHLICIDYTAKAESISQLVITAKINDTINTSVTVSGTNGKMDRAYIDFTTNSEKGSIVLSFLKLASVQKITVMA